MLPPEQCCQSEERAVPEMFGITVEPLISQVINKQQTDIKIRSLPSGLKQDSPNLWKDIQGTWKLLVPEVSKQRVLHEYHDTPLAGHPWTDETVRAIRRRFTWDNIRQDVRAYVKQCHLCACTKATRPNHLDQLQPHQPTTPWTTVADDLMGPYPRTGRGKKFILV